jgi:hypothetical protein
MDRRDFLLAAAAGPLALSFAPRALAEPLGGTPLAFVTADLESHVVALDLATGRTVARIQTSGGPRSIEAVQGTKAVVAHTERGVVSILDSISGKVRTELPDFAAPRYTAARPPSSFAAESLLAYVTDSVAGEVVTLDVARGSVVARATVPGAARHITITPDGDAIWTALGSKAAQIAVLDTRTARRPELVRVVRPPFLAHDVVAAPDGRHVWVTSGDSRRVAIYGRAGRTPVVQIAAGAPPQHIAFVGRLAFVTSGDDGTVSVHRQDGRRVHQADVPVGSYNVTFGWRRAVIPSLSSGTVVFLDPGGQVRTSRKVARAAHDACVLVGP